MKRFKLSLTNNPVFNTVTGLSNTTFDPTNIVVNRGATEGQIKYVKDLIDDLQTWLDENGCSNDPYALIRAKVDELEAAIEDCCANPQDSVIQELQNRLSAIEVSIENECQKSSVVDQAGDDGCDGNEIELSLSWNNPNNHFEGGKITATSSMSGRSIVKYYFQNNNSFGTFSVDRVGGAGSTDAKWKIDNSGNISTEGGTPQVGMWRTVVAEDSQGCKGVKRIYLPGGNIVGG